MTSSDIDIARRASMQPITQVAEKFAIPKESVLQFGPYKGKISFAYLDSLQKKSDGKLILVTAISPTPAGEGKTTTTVGLGDGLNAIGKKTIIALREPSLGPCFGIKGGAAGGGYAQIVPMEDINLHFTGDFHAITSAHNLLSAMIDNHVYWGNALKIDTRRIEWRRVIDMNDRALRDIVSSLGGTRNGYPRQTGFDITVASEVMAIFCLARSLKDLRKRLGDIVVGYTRDLQPITARHIKADGPMTVLLKDALMPNLVQTLENNAAFVHGGPFANIAHGCNSVFATKSALKISDYVVTEAGFGADLGAEKFFDIKCQKANITPDAVVVVATVRALKMHGGKAKNALKNEDVSALKAGLCNLERHLENIAKFGVKATVAINAFVTDTKTEIQVIKDFCHKMGVVAFEASHWEHGSKGITDLAKHIVATTENKQTNFKPLYKKDLTLFEKIETICKEIYRAEDVTAEPKVFKQLEAWEKAGYAHLPVCMAKTQMSFSTDPTKIGAPTGHKVNIREVRLAAGAGFIVAITGAIMTMPGLPRKPSAESIVLDESDNIQGLF